MKQPNIQRAVIWGDSLARGVIYDENRSRYTIASCTAADMVAQELGIEVINRSRMGMTTTQGIQTMKKDMQKGLCADVAVLEFGGNDCDFNWKAISDAPDQEHQPKTPASEFENNMKQMIGSVKSAGMKPVIVNLPPIHAEKYFQFLSGNGLSRKNILRWLGDTFQIYRYQERYSMMVTRIARECGCLLLDVRSAFLNVWNTSPLFCHDGIHPTAEGQKLIGKAILAEI